MSSEPENASCRDTFDLVHGFIIASMQGESTEDEIADFEQLLRDSPEARRLYATYLEDTINLTGVLSVPPAVAASQAATSAKPAAASAAGKSGQSRPLNLDVPEDVLSDPAPPKSPVLGFLGGVVDYVNHSRRLMFLLIAVTLSGWFVFQVGSVLVGRWLAGDEQVVEQGTDQPGAKPSAGSLAGGTDGAHDKALARLSGSVSGRWQVVAKNPAEPAFWEIGREFTAGQRVKLVAGLAEITFRSGAKIVVTAPAQIAITSALGTDLRVGKLAARVPHSASGFAVVTPAGSVVDLGTEFGVEVTADKKMDVQVFVGEVKVNSPEGGEVDGPAEVHVTAGHTVHVAPGQPAAIVESKASRFHRDLELGGDSNDKATADYIDFVQQLKPVVWLRMEGKEADRTIRDEMGRAPDGKLIWEGAGNPFVGGRVGKGLWLRGPKLKECAVIPDYPKPARDEFSVSAWVYAESRPEFATIAANWEGDHGRFHFCLVPSYKPGGNDLGLEIFNRDGGRALIREGDSAPFPLNDWQHVAFTADGETLRLYRQGREVAMQKHAGFVDAAACKALYIGASNNSKISDPHQEYYRFWDGKLDEITVFDKVLTADEIKKLAAAPPN